MKKLLLLIVTLCAVTIVSAQDIVTLTVSGQGATKEAATATALRSAIEQAFGVFVSANTEILNDNLVKDEIATVSSGNIQTYSEISCINMSSKEVSVTLSATVSIGKLVAYAKSKGSAAEFAGQTFAMNMKIRELNKQNEIKALQHAQQQLKAIAEHMFNWKLSIGDPYISGNDYAVNMTVTAESNEASDAFYKTFFGVLKSLELKSEELREYIKNNNRTYTIRVQSCDDEGLDPWGNSQSYKEVFSFRSEYIYDFIEDVHYILRAASIGFSIRESNDAIQAYSMSCDKYPPKKYTTEGRERRQLIRNANAIYDINHGGYHVGENYLTYDRSIDVWGLSKYTIKTVQKKKSPTPVIHSNNIFKHEVKIHIPNDKIGSIVGFEVVHKPKSRIDVE